MNIATLVLLATAAAGGLGLRARAQDLPAAPAGASERLEIRQLVESWYQIEQGLTRDAREHRGWAHERIRPVEGREWRYEYSYESEGRYERLLGGGTAGLQHVREKVAAKLDASFDLVTLDAEVRVDDRAATLSVYRTAGGARTEATALSGDVSRIAESGEAPILHTLALGLLQLRQKGGLRSAETKPAVLLDGLFQFAALHMRRDVLDEGRLKLAEGRRIPAIPVEFRPASANDSAKPVLRAMLDRYGRTIEVVAEVECYVRTLVDSEREARPAGDQVADRGRDPFQAPREKLPPPAPPINPDKALADLERMAQDIARVAELDVALAGDRYEEFYAAWRKGRAAAEDKPVLQSLMDMTAEDAHRAVGRHEHELRLARRILERLGTSAEAEDEAGARAAARRISELLERFAPTSEAAAQLRKLVEEAQAKLADLTAGRELQRMNLVIAGASTQSRAVKVPLHYTVCVFSATAVIDTEVRFWLREEWVIINDNVYRAGDCVSGTDVRVERIFDQGCVVSYKGARRTLLLPR